MLKHAPGTWLKYVTKGEPTSMSAYAIFASCAAKLSDNDNQLTAPRSSLPRAVGERDFSAQETAHMLMGTSLQLYIQFCMHLT